MKKLLVALVVLIATVAPVAIAQPALANHDNYYGHWVYPPVVSTPQNGWEDSIQDAAYYWQDNAFYRGYYPPLPNKDNAACGGIVNRINICVVAPGDSRLHGYAGWTDVWYDSYKHIYAAATYVDWSLTGANKQNIFRHEFGHALGLGHNTHTTGSVMRAAPLTPYADAYDIQGILTWQECGC